MTKEIIELENKHILNTYGRVKVAFTRGRGVYLEDPEGKKYLDFLSGLGVNILGHSHPALVAAIEKQAKELIHTSNLYYTEPQARLAAELNGYFGPAKVFFANSGAEANEGALKIALKHMPPEKTGIIAMKKSFHGRTVGALSLTGQEVYHAGFESLLLKNVAYADYNDAASLESLFSKNTAAVIIEAIQGEGGVNPGLPAFLRKARELCDRHGAVMIIDEIQAGMGRTGKFFAFSHYGIEPDIVTLAKGLAGGVPAGAVLIKDEIARSMTKGSHASTFGGNPLAASCSLAVLKTLKDEGLMDNAARMGALIMDAFSVMKGKYPFIKDIRGKGLMIGIELDIDAAPVVEKALGEGLLINAIKNRVIRMLPPLVLGEKDAEKGIGIIDGILQKY